MLDDLVGLKGIGKQRAAELAEIGIKTIKDLFGYFPYRYEDYNLKDLTEAKHGDKVTVEGTIYSEPLLKKVSKNRTVLSIKVLVDDYSGLV